MVDHDQQDRAATATSAVPLVAHGRSLKHLGTWTTSRRFDIRASRSSVVLDLFLPELEPGDIEISLDIDHAVVKLLVPDGVVIDDADLRRVGGGRVKDWTGSPRPGGRLIRLRGELRDSEVRIHRGGIAILSLLTHGERAAVRRARFEGRI